VKDTNILIITDHQHAGKGRHGRKWESEKYSNLTFTMRMRFEIEAKDVQCVNYFFTYYTLSGIENYYLHHSVDKQHNFSIKWPNDILTENKKLSGILIERIYNKKDYIIGIGINVNQNKFDREYDQKSTSLSNILKQPCNIDELLFELLNIYDKHLYLLHDRQFTDIYAFWKERCTMIGKKISLIDSKNNKINAVVTDLMYDGGIKLVTSNGEKVYYSGDVHLI
jgi:BirA family transcriptional regulator, biotin operon repressor / biotin---[acetyl-CoA-carboxylase] ligase